MGEECKKNIEALKTCAEVAAVIIHLAKSVYP